MRGSRPPATASLPAWPYRPMTHAPSHQHMSTMPDDGAELSPQTRPRRGRVIREV
ncbi:hypothetical protein BC826DRAFT_1040095 [Russula brevipes]|nr:hypothetical protein BC826DRAFT_1040095 [Russula brevipes]